MKRLQVRVHGLVQGVFFRVSTQRKAQELGLAGSVRNDPDGSVAIEVEGAGTPLDEFLAWCRRGPPNARVDRVDFVESEARGAKRFTIED